MAVGVIKEKAESILFKSYEGDTLVIQENTLRAHNIPQMIEPQTLGAIMQESVVVENDENKEVICNYPERNLYGFCVDELLYQIGICESRLKPVCNSGGCGFGRGLYQLIKSTQELCQMELNKNIDPFDGANATECALWLYKNHGTRDWGYEGAEWGSWNCWKKYLN